MYNKVTSLKDLKMNLNVYEDSLFSLDVIHINDILPLLGLKDVEVVEFLKELELFREESQQQMSFKKFINAFKSEYLDVFRRGGEHQYLFDLDDVISMDLYEKDYDTDSFMGFKNKGDWNPMDRDSISYSPLNYFIRFNPFFSMSFMEESQLKRCFF